MEILPDKTELARGRDLDKKTKLFKKGFFSAYINSYRGHQLSGLVLKRENLFEVYQQYAVHNLYPFIFFVAYTALHGDLLHLTDYPVKVTQPGQDKKYWGYGNDGLICDIFDNYKKLPVSGINKSLLQTRLLIVQHWRYLMYFTTKNKNLEEKGIRASGIKNGMLVIKNIMTSENTLFLTKILFAVYLPFLFSLIIARRIVKAIIPPLLELKEYDNIKIVTAKDYLEIVK
jgi:hypothetical protein